MAAKAHFKHWYRTIPILAVFWAVPFAAADELPEFSSASRLAGVYVRAARSLLGVQPMTIENVEIAAALAEEAALLAPSDPEILRFVIDIALLTEHTELYEEGLKRLVQLDPYDDVALLRRLNLLIEERNTVEERVIFIDQLLARPELSAPVRSRLALDKAILLERNGDLDAFADALTVAVELDPANRSAAAIAAGFFRMNVPDPYAQAELLVNVVLADPTDIVTQAALARLLLENGAYTAAARFYKLAIKGTEKKRSFPSADILADRALALWAAGNTTEALRLIDDRQRLVDDMYRYEIQKNLIETKNEYLAPLELSRLHGHISPSLAVVRVAILAERKDPEAAEALGRAMQVYRDSITEGVKDGTLSDHQLSQLHLEAAILFLWLSHAHEPAAMLLQRANEKVPLSESAQRRFEGWVKLRAGAADEAIELLRDLAEGDAAASIGLAQAYLTQGDKNEAARAYLAAARAQPSSVFGIWAAHRLADLVGEALPTSKQAGALEELIASIPYSFDRFVDYPSEAIELTVKPAKQDFEPFEPVVVNIEIANNSPYPLAIDRDGPINSLIVLQVRARYGPAAQEGRLPDIIAPIDRRLRLEPRERLIVPVDLRTYDFGRSMDEATKTGSGVVRGTLLSVTAISNFIVTTDGVVEPSLLGLERNSGIFRIEGMEPSPEWMTQTISDLVDGELSDDDIVRMALLGHQIASFRRPEYLERLLQLDAQEPIAESRVATHPVRLQRLELAYADSFALASPVEQAWLLAVLPSGEIPQPVREIVAPSNERLVRLTYLMFQLTGRNDPILLAARQDDDQQLRRVGEAFEHQFALRVIQQQQLEDARRRAALQNR